MSSETKMSITEKRAKVARGAEPPGLWDVGNPNSIYDLMDEELGERFLKARLTRPDLFVMGESELRDYFKENLRRQPSVSENQIRLRFWLEYDFIQAGDQRKITAQAVSLKVCDLNSLRGYLNKAESAAWISCMPMTYEDHLLELMNYGAAKMREIMRLPLMENGKVNTKLAALQKSIYEAAELRMMGAIPTVEKHLNYNVHETRQAAAKAVEDEGTRLIEDKVQEMERLSLKGPKKKDVVTVDV